MPTALWAAKLHGSPRQAARSARPRGFARSKPELVAAQLKAESSVVALRAVSATDLRSAPLAPTGPAFPTRRLRKVGTSRIGHGVCTICIGLSLLASACGDDPVAEPNSTGAASGTGAPSSNPSTPDTQDQTNTGANSDSTQSDSTQSDSGSTPEGIELPEPNCAPSPAMPALVANTMVQWLSIPMESSAVGQDISGMGQLVVTEQGQVFMSGARKVHRLDLGANNQCSWSSPNANQISISAIAHTASTNALVVSFRNPNQKEGQMGLYLDQGKRFVHAKTPQGDPATSLLASTDPQGNKLVLATFPGRLFSQSLDQGRTWTDLQTRQDALFTDLKKDRNGAHIWALGKDTSGAGVVTWVSAQSPDAAGKTHTSYPAKWRWDATGFETAQVDTHTDHSLLFGTSAQSTGEPLVARATASPDLGTLNVRELWTGPSTTTFSGVTAIWPLEKAGELLVGGRGKKAGASPLLYLNSMGETQSIAVGTERKLQVLDIAEVGSGAERKVLVSSTDGTDLFLHVVGALSIVPET